MHRPSRPILLAALFVTTLSSHPVLVAAEASSLPNNAFQVSWTNPHLVYDVEFTTYPSTTPPGKEATWQAKKLPHLWANEDLSVDRGWYRIPLQKPAIGDEIVGVYLWRYNMNARIYFNNELLADGGRFDAPAARNVHRPQLARISPAAWLAEENYVYVYLRTYPVFGHLQPIAIGPYEPLKAAYEERMFYQIELSQFLFVVTLIITFVGLVLWLADRSSRAYLYFTLSCAFWTIYSVNPWIRDLPIPMREFLWLLHVSIDGFAVTLMLFLHREFGYRKPAIEGIALTYLASTTIAYGLFDYEQIALLAPWVHLGSLLIGLYIAVFLLFEFYRSRRPDALLFAATLLVLFGLGIHDVLMVTHTVPDIWRDGYLRLNQGAPLMFLVFAGHLAWRLRSNQLQLEKDISAATLKLEASYRDRENLQRENAAAEERDRIYRDLHDDLGAKLLSLVYSAETPETAELARDTLKEIRSLAAEQSTEPVEVDDLLASWHQEAEIRCNEAEITLTWQSQEADFSIGPLSAFHLTRVLRELLTNVFVHSNATKLNISASIVDAFLRIEVRDNGHGVSDNQPGSGHRGINKRLAQIRGSFSFESTAKGCIAIVTAPCTNQVSWSPAK